MFHEARIKLTAWYLAIIMAISLSFSVVIYFNVNRELSRVEVLQDQRQGRITAYIRTNGYSLPPDVLFQADVDTAQSRGRILTALAFINAAILLIAGGGGYFLAGQTLEPIGKMMEEQKEFVGNASHELRTPLTSLMTEIEVALRDKKMTLKDAKNLLSSNLDDVKSITKLSNYLLKLSRYERAGEDVEFTEVDMKKILKDSIDRVNSLAKVKHIKIELRGGPVKVKGNSDSLTELGSILIENAVKYSGKGKKVQVSIRKKGFDVVDHGVGIAKEDIPHVFDRFYRADASRSKGKRDGYGLGLAIAKSIVDLHGGSIKVTSKLDKGSTFSVTLG